MKSKTLSLVKAVGFIFIGVLIFVWVQYVMTPASILKADDSDRRIHGFYEIEDNTIDILFLGTSTVKHGASPMQLYKDAGIISYNRATDAQPIEVSYYLLKDSFVTQHPSVVVCDVSGLFLGRDSVLELGWRYVLENYPLNSIKYQMAQTYDEFEAGAGMMSVIFPIIKYHSRWNELTSADFKMPELKQESYSCGESLHSSVKGNSDASIPEINSIAEFQQEPTRKNEFVDGVYSFDEIDEKLNVPEISQSSIEYLCKMKKLCDENGARLILTKVPTLMFPQNNSSAWTIQKSKMIKQIANEYGLQFLDMVYDYDCEIDWTKDTIDGGAHLNLRGGKKVTAALEDYLLKSFSFTQKSNAQYDEYLALYQKVNDVGMLQSETNLHEYLQKLIDNKDKWIILIAASEDFTDALDENTHIQLEELGLIMSRDAVFSDSYLALIDRGELKYEAVSGRRLDYETSLSGIDIKMGSAGWKVGSYSNLSINGKDYATKGRGLNFVVYDTESELVIDTVSFDTFLPGMKFSRNQSLVNSLLRAYEQKMCF